AAVKAVPRHRTPKSFKQSRRVVPQHLLLQELAEAQGAECVDILAEGGDARRWPVRPPQDLLGDFREARKVSRQRLRRNAGDIQVYVGMPPRQKERRIAIKRPPCMREYDRQ